MKTKRINLHVGAEARDRLYRHGLAVGLEPGRIIEQLIYEHVPEWIIRRVQATPGYVAGTIGPAEGDPDRVVHREPSPDDPGGNGVG
jgi:hypothetical protein